ncbi:MAG: DUF1836 domain-containing protein [Ruminococcaceae bacterium]|nr:DUF1836 domain-containing protein [Oscillospiraceae bacterium]
MQWTIPGTVLPAVTSEAGQTGEKFRAMFFGGGMVLSQVSAITGLEPYIIQNWVKRGFLTKPVGKRYTLRQLCRIININMLKDALKMEDICGLMTYLNGHLDDESDDLIDDSQLYFLFLQLAGRYQELRDPDLRAACVAEVLENYQEPIPGARLRVEKVLTIMLTAWLASLLCQQATNMIAELKAE